MAPERLARSLSEPSRRLLRGFVDLLHEADEKDDPHEAEYVQLHVEQVEHQQGALREPERAMQPGPSARIGGHDHAPAEARVFDEPLVEARVGRRHQGEQRELIENPRVERGRLDEHQPRLGQGLADLPRTLHVDLENDPEFANLRKGGRLRAVIESLRPSQENR